MKMAAKASYRAVPSMLMVAPTGSTNLVTRLSTPLFSSRHLKVMGRVAELRTVRERVSAEGLLSTLSGLLDRQFPLGHGTGRN